MKLSPRDIEHLVLLAADGTGLMIPAVAAVVPLLHQLAKVLEESGVIPATVPAETVERLRCHKESP